MFHSTRRAVTIAVSAAALAVVVAGCSAPARDQPAATSGGEAKEVETLTFVNPLPAAPVWQEISKCIQEEAEANGIEFTEAGPPASSPGDPTVMIQLVQDAVAAGTDAIITFPASDAFGPVLQQAQEAGVLTATLYGDGKPESGATVNAGADWSLIGEQYVEAISAVPGDHVVGLVAEAPTGVGKSWIDGVTAAAEKTDNVTISDTVYVGADASQALPQVTALLTANPDIDIVASNTGIMTAGGVAAIESLGLQDKVKLVAINNANGGPEAIRDGAAIGLFLQDTCDLGARTVGGLVEAATGADVPLIPVKAVIATQDDLDEYLDKGWG
ncbi:sugar ABC transporter substrate-binding protein [Microbacterium sp. RD1]|uniref:sugar ABC transporter substrate-binding protein n=1 Tax=Microbacterium sp. RD1 TaxID=3457313 RepID=UPI003FA56CAC